MSPNSPRTVQIVYATMTGNTRDAVDWLSRELQSASIHHDIHEMRDFDPHRLSGAETALFLSSTFGNGDPPDGAYAFWDVLRKSTSLRLDKLRFSVLALGDAAYPRFCQFGEDLDARLKALGASELAPLQKCSVDWEQPFEQWLRAVLGSLSANRV